MEKSYCLNTETQQEYQEKEIRNGFKLVLPNSGIYPNGINIRGFGTNILVRILWQGRRTNKRVKLILKIFCLPKIIKIYKPIAPTIIILERGIKMLSEPPSTITGKGPTKSITLAIVELSLESTNATKTSKMPIRTETKPILGNKKEMLTTCNVSSAVTVIHHFSKYSLR